ncbi:hypothetical protein ACO0OL_001681 [Hanseniaspora opuntiae]|uniref:Stationary phase protein 4 n=1 Tax=Hanseniaspora opuntiae TaxID=211096 RepID=A0A1E5RWS1_9ASCO|nr:hypothetical protein AWRI3578_g308 [Hanseniaspora opuntiae]
MEKFLNAFAVYNPNKHIKDKDNKYASRGGGNSNPGKATEVIYAREWSDPSQARKNSGSSMTDDEKRELLSTLPTSVDWTKMTKAEWNKIGMALLDDPAKTKNSPNNRVNI